MEALVHKKRAMHLRLCFCLKENTDEILAGSRGEVVKRVLAFVSISHTRKGVHISLRPHTSNGETEGALGRCFPRRGRNRAGVFLWHSITSAWTEGRTKTF